MGNVRKTPTDYHALAKERGFKWLAPMPTSTNTKTTWECEKGHTWEAKYSNIFRGRGCPACSNRLPKTEQDYHALALKRGFRWRGPFPKSTNVKTGWQCEKDHTWESKYGNIKAGKGCPVCAKLKRSGAKKANPTTRGRKVIIPQDYHILAKKRGFKWLGPKVQTTNVKTGWECEQGHQWQAPYGAFTYKESGCPTCSRVRLRGVPKAKAKRKPAAKKREPKQAEPIKTVEWFRDRKPAAMARFKLKRQRLTELNIVGFHKQREALLACDNREDVEFEGKEEMEWETY